MKTHVMRVPRDVRFVQALMLCVLLTLTQQTQQAAQTPQTANTQEAAHVAQNQQAVQTAQTMEILGATETEQKKSGQRKIPPESSASTSKRHRRTVDSNPYQQLVDALQSQDISDSDLYMHYTPSTPAPHNINCYVEVPTILRRGGRCIRLGRGRAFSNRPWACQAGVHLAFSSHCGQRARAARGGRG